MSEISNRQSLYTENNNKADNKRRDYSALARELKRHQGWVVGVLQDQAYAGREMPSDLSIENLQSTWGDIPGVRIISMDADMMRSYTLLFNGKMDILVYPYGSVFPMDAMGLYSAQTFNHFLNRGGAVLTTGGIPFMKQAGPRGDIVGSDTPEEMTEVFDKWVSKFGIKYYECMIPPAKTRANTALLPSLPEHPAYGPSRYGVVVNNSSHDPVPKPPHGNVFPERYPVKQVTPLLTGEDRFGERLSTSALLVQDYENGSRRIHFTQESSPHPLSPNTAGFSELMQDLFRLLTNRMTVAVVEPEYACYRQGETVDIRAEVVSHEPCSERVVLRLEITGQDGVVHVLEQTATHAPGRHSYCWQWKPERFATDEYTFRVQVLRDGTVVSEAENGFIVWDEACFGKGTSLGIRQDYFTLGDKGAFITGTNYYESTLGEIMWFRPNTANIIRDFHRMHDSFVNMIRPHYHHRKWFKDYLLYQHDKLFPFYSELDGEVSPLPSEKDFRVWDLFIYLCNKYGIVYNGDLFTLVPEEMGDPRGWFGTVESVYDPEKRQIQKQFLKELEIRYKDIPGISWDLFNEPYCIPDSDVGEWARDLRMALVDAGSQRLVTVGGPLSLGDATDYDCPHGQLSEDFINRRGRPVLLQELHIDKPEPLKYELIQSEELRRIIVCSLHSGVAGVCPWSWTRQMRLWQDAYEHHHSFPMEKWDDRLGLNTHDDGTLKPAGQVFKDMAALLRGIDFMSCDPETNVIDTTKGQLLARTAKQAGSDGHQILHAKDGKYFAAMALQQVKIDNDCLLAGPLGKYVFFFVEEADFLTAKELYVKTEGTGTLKICRGNGKLAQLVSIHSSTVVVLETVDCISDEGSTSVIVDEEMSRYWLRIQF